MREIYVNTRLLIDGQPFGQLTSVFVIGDDGRGRLSHTRNDITYDDGSAEAGGVTPRAHSGARGRHHADSGRTPHHEHRHVAPADLGHKQRTPHKTRDGAVTPFPVPRPDDKTVTPSGGGSVSTPQPKDKGATLKPVMAANVRAHGQERLLTPHLGAGDATGAGDTYFDAIIRAEGTNKGGRNPYTTVLGYGQYGSPSKPLTDMTLDEAYAFGRTVKAKHGSSSAIGAFQIVGKTMKAAMAGLGMTGDEKFSPQNQRRIAEWIRQKQGFGAWEGFKGHPEELRRARDAVKHTPNSSIP